MKSQQLQKGKDSPWADDKYSKVTEAFYKLHETGREIGSALCIYHNGKPVVDLWAGNILPENSQQWRKDTMTSTFSASKAMVALCLLHLIDNKKAQLNDTVVQYWPEFATNDHERKSLVTLKHLLNHSAGIPIAKKNKPGDFYSWNKMISAIEKSPLLWEPGAHTAYHAVTFGHLVGEVIHRISGMMPSAYFSKHFAIPMDLSYTLRFKEENASRTTNCDGDDWVTLKLFGAIMSYAIPLLRIWRLEYFRPCALDYHPNTKAWRQAEAPAVTGYGTARDLARVYSMLSQRGELEGQRYFSDEMAKQIAGIPHKPDIVKELGTDNEARIGLGLFFNHSPLAEFGPNENSFGHCGMGGTTSFADPDRKIGFGYVCNHLHKSGSKDSSMYGDRAIQLIDALYDSQS